MNKKILRIDEEDLQKIRVILRMRQTYIRESMAECVECGADESYTYWNGKDEEITRLIHLLENN